jgi:hypothetical protein
MGNLLPRVSPPPSEILLNFAPQNYYDVNLRDDHYYYYYYKQEIGNHETWRIAMTGVIAYLLGASTYFYILFEICAREKTTERRRARAKIDQRSSRVCMCKFRRVSHAVVNVSFV